MPGPVKHHRGNRKSGDNSDLTMDSVAREIAISFPADSPVLAVFRDAAKKLNKRNELHERLVKLSREITVECNRITFLFHSPITTDSSENTVTEAKELIQKLINGPIKSIGLELEHCPEEFQAVADAVTAGFQEYVQARIMLSFMTEKRIITYPEVQKELEYTIIDNENQMLLVTKIPQSHYMLGLADLTKELMRKVINSISNGDTEECFKTSYVLRQLYSGYLGQAGEGHLDQKLPEIRANLHKVEQALYALRVRGSEMPPQLLLPDTPTEPRDSEDPFNQSDNDEGYYY